MRPMQIEVTAYHDRHGCHWTVKHDQCPAWTWNGVPDESLWLAGAGCCCESTALARTDDTFRDDLGTVFERVIGDIRGRTTCSLCWPDVSSRRQVAAAARLNRNVPRLGHEIPLYVPERAEPVGSVYVPRLGQFASLDDAGALAELDVLDAEIADLMAKQERMTSQPASKPPVSYATARERFMETGTITHKEAMLEFVTMAEPDLDTIGRDWEPKPERKPARMTTATRRRTAVALTTGAAALAVFHGLLLNGWAFLTWIAFVLLAAAWVMNGKAAQ